MATVFGLPAVDVESPNGEVTPYLFAEEPTRPNGCREWILTKPDGAKYRVREVLFNYFRCDCKNAVCRQQLGGCKHVRAILKHLGREL